MSQCKAELSMDETTYYCVEDDGHDGSHTFSVQQEDIPPTEAPVEFVGQFFLPEQPQP